MVPEGYYEDLVRGVVAGHRWITAFGNAVPAVRYAEKLLSLGAESCLAISGSRGAGELSDEIQTIILGTQGTSMMDGIRLAESAIDDLPASARQIIDDFDPARSARVLRPLFSEGRPVAGRLTYGRRRPEWVALEDKMIADALWDSVGIPRAPSVVVPVSQAWATSPQLDQGAGTVWAGDNRSGWHGGASLLRWVQTAADAEEAERFLGAQCDRVRVMPFLDGIPCSIHGIVFDNQVIALRPCEMIVLRQPGPSKLRYAAAASFWDPQPADRQVMRETARTVGAHLRERVDYRGVFTVDGVMTAQGFLPTELNPRFGAAIGSMTAAIPRLPMYLLHLAIAAREPLEWRPEALETLILSAADANRSGRAGTVVQRTITENISADLCWRGGEFAAAQSGEEADAKLHLGPAGAGGYLNISFVAARTPTGPSLAPRAVAALEYADQAYDLGIGPLTPAPVLR